MYVHSFQHLKDFDMLTRVFFKDGSFALGIRNAEGNKNDNMGSLKTDSWTVPRVYRNEEKSDFSRGPYYGILVIDRQSRPVLAAFRENTNYVAFYYYIDGNWRWAQNSRWKEIFRNSKGLSLDPEAPRFKLRSCRI